MEVKALKFHDEAHWDLCPFGKPIHQKNLQSKNRCRGLQITSVEFNSYNPDLIQGQWVLLATMVFA